MATRDKLSDMEQRFVDEYPKTLNAKQAAIDAGYSPRGAKQRANKLMARPRVRAAIEKKLLARSQRTDVDADWVLRRLVDEAEADIADLYDENNQLLPVKQWPLIWRQGLLSGVDVQHLFDKDGDETGEIVKIRLSERIRRIELIGKHVNVKAFEDKTADAIESLADRLAAARARRNGGSS